MMDEPTNEQLKILRKDIMSGRVMTVEVEHYRRLTDNLDKSYDANKGLQTELKAKDERIKFLEAEKSVLCDELLKKTKALFKFHEKNFDVMEKNERIKELEAENKQLLELSENLDEHPEGYDGPCLCKLCKSY